ARKSMARCSPARGWFRGRKELLTLGRATRSRSNLTVCVTACHEPPAEQIQALRKHRHSKSSRKPREHNHAGAIYSKRLNGNWIQSRQRPQNPSISGDIYSFGCFINHSTKM